MAFMSLLGVLPFRVNISKAKLSELPLWRKAISLVLCLFFILYVLQLDCQFVKKYHLDTDTKDFEYYMYCFHSVLAVIFSIILLLTLDLYFRKRESFMLVFNEIFLQCKF